MAKQGKSGDYGHHLKKEVIPMARRKKKWGKIGAPHSKKRKEWMKKIRRMRKKKRRKKRR